MRVDLPNEYIQDFIASYEIMADKSLVYYYVKSDQDEITKHIKISCRLNKLKGRFEGS